MPANEKKTNYVEKMSRMLATYNKVLLVECDHVGSAQMQQIRKALRGRAEMLMGKNTLMRKCISIFMQKNKGHPVALLSQFLRGNLGVVFTNDNLREVRDIIEANRVPAPARAGTFAPNDVVVPAGATGCDPGQTSFFQALNIATKIARGQVEIISPVHLLSKGEKVNPGQAALLAKLDIKPFSYGLQLKLVYENGSTFSPAVLALSEDDIAHRYLLATRNIAAISLQTGLPTLASVPHSLVNAAKKLTAIVVDDSVDYSFDFAEPFLKYLADPSAFAVAAAPAAGGAAAAAKVEEEEEEEDDGAGAAAVGGLFGDDAGGSGY